MMTFLQHNVLLSQLIVGIAFIGMACLIMWVCLRPEPDPYAAAHRGRRHAWRLRSHVPRHGERYTPRHEHAAAGLGVALGHSVDGDIALIHDLGDEPTNASIDALFGPRADELAGVSA